ncbi:hypothetical protein [Paenibacillus apiarius]|uniref:Uncharacterized protein n=1 Tax=Paenibacillus apiarius TaxID=46240 RepID=A0ABT4DMX1_9BACL|nr:hypothetical protein [Paenibacillus apiarius]MCY9513534.1 hypothetical protein [Paenibacillus apiarius]MCY9518085.1 hypothetical protein [Paenibacillus apiarius]MCY9551514.1 hypothetical protein [Paenibacillus apiarius]MCY9558668.1 hypothetical protein [Paenibacillus apiarius]MCY9684018.1 hypothetical protein [Paenibacillus apiarius]
MNIIEKLIDFVMSNPLIAIVIIGALFSAMGKGQKKGGTNRMPDFGGSGQAGTAGQAESRRYDDEDEAPVYMDSKGRTDHSRGGADREDAGAWADDRMAEHQLAAIDRTTRQMSAGTSASLHGRSNSRSAASSSITDNEIGGPSDFINPEDALKGVAWAEILGPPRAKRPYGGRS